MFSLGLSNWLPYFAGGERLAKPLRSALSTRIPADSLMLQHGGLLARAAPALDHLRESLRGCATEQDWRMGKRGGDLLCGANGQ
jgi:hypothetical protein